MIRKTIKGGNFKPQMVGELEFDQVPEEGSFNPVTSDAVAKIAGDVADLDAIVPEDASEENKLATASDVAGVQADVDSIEGKIPSDTSTTNKLVNESGLQDAIDNASESWSTGFTPKGESSVSDLNDLATQSNGDSYIVTDSGTLTDGSLVVVAGDQVAWDATNSVWYKLPQYALKQFGTNEIKNLSTTITTFRTGDVIAVDGPSGTANMSKDTLLELTAQNALAGNVAQAFDAARTSENPYKAGERVVYEGKTYTFKVDHYGAWTGADVIAVDIATLVNAVRLYGTLKSETLFNMLNTEASGVALGKLIASDGSLADSASYNTSDFIPVIGGSTLVSSDTVNYAAFYDSERNIIGSRILDQTIYNVPYNALYFRLSITTDSWSSMMLSYDGCLPGYYVAYGKYVFKDSLVAKVKSGNVQGFLDKAQSDYFLFNLIDLDDDDVALGKYVSTNGALIDSSSYNTTGFIGVVPGVKFVCNKAIRFINFYDSSKNVVSYGANLYADSDIAIADNVSFVRFSLSTSNWTGAMFSSKGAMPSGFMDFGYIKFKDKLITEPVLFKNVLGYVGDDQLKLVKLNLLNVSDEDVALGYYVTTDGSLVANSDYNTTGWIAVSDLKKYKSSVDIRFLGCYNSNKNYISTINNVSANTEITLPSNTAFVRLSIRDYLWTNSMFSTTANFPSFYMPFGVKKIDKSYLDESKKQKSYVAKGDLAENEKMYISDALCEVKATRRVCFACTFSEFVNVKVGLENVLGVNVRGIKVTATQIIPYTDSTEGAAVSHGLTISNNLQVVLSVGVGTITAKLTSNGETYTAQNIVIYPDTACRPYALAGGALTDCTLSQTFTNILSDKIYMGDSYSSMTSDKRWPYYINADGLAKYTIFDGFGGESSANSVTALRNILRTASPKFIVWALGMNDGSDSASAPSSAWVTGRDAFLSMCDEVGAIPVFGTIPTVPSVNNEKKNAWIRSSGYRFIDFAKAVGANSSGVWYSGMLDTDNVHPTEKGAKSLYAQALVDFPELMVG